MTTAPTATVDIATITHTGGFHHVYHAAVRSISDALGLISEHAPAPVNAAVRRRIERDRGGVIQIGQITAAIAVHA
jgi:hypothetical protein